MTDDVYMVAIASLLPLVAMLLVLQTNPYQALVIRGILGAIAALVYAMLGAADVALTEALVGTMLSITLYAIAVRSSMTLRIGIVQQSTDGYPNEPINNPAREQTVDAISTNEAKNKTEDEPISDPIEALAKQQVSTVVRTPSTDTFQAIEQALSKHHVRVEVLSYTEPTELEIALQKKEIHIAYESASDVPLSPDDHTINPASSLLRVRTQQLYNILQAKLPSHVSLSLITPTPRPTQAHT